MLTELILSLITLAIVILGYAKYKLSYWSRRGVRSLPTHPIYGNLKEVFTLKKAPGEVLREMYDNCNSNERYLGFYIFHKPVLLIRDYELIKHIMIKDFNVFADRGFGDDKDSLAMVNLLSVRHPRWKYMRSKITPSLTGQKIKTMIPLIMERNKPLIEQIESLEESDGSAELEVKDLSCKYTSDLIASLAFGVTTNSFNNQENSFYDAGQKILMGPVRGFILMILFLIPEFAKFIYPFCQGPAQYFREIFWDSLNTREKIGKKRGDFIDSLIALKNGEQNPEYKFEGDNLLTQAIALFVAGFEATASAIAFTLLELSKNQEYQERVYNEIQEIIGDKEEWTVEMLNETVFLDSVFNEVLRLYPALPLMSRIALEDYKIPGSDLIIEKGTFVHFSISGFNQDSRYFSNPKTFDPLRWTKESPNTVNADLLSFGLGPRACLGQRAGQLITKIAVIAIMQKYEMTFKPTKGEELSPGTVFTVAAEGLHVRLKKRQQA